MKKGLLYGSVMVLGAAVTAISLNSSSNDDGYYEPRTGAQKASYGAQGAIEWWQSVRANPTTGKVDLEDVMAAREQLDARRSFAKKSVSNLSWQEVGPNNIGGRTRAFLIDRDSTNELYAGSVSGGLYKSSNAGASWTELTTDQDYIAISSIAQASDGTIYYGTGENLYISYGGNGNESTPGFSGNGIYKVTDNGKTITHLTSTSVSNGSEWSAVGKLFVDPNNDQRIYAATIRGLRLSTDGGDTWTNPLVANAGGGASNAARDLFVTETGKVWAKVGSEIWYSPSGNSGDYTRMTGGALPTKLPSNSNRMRVAVSPQDENYVYVVAINNDDQFEAAYRTIDGGATWNKIGEQSAFLSPHRDQGTWNNAVTVDPFNKDRVLIGGVDLYEWSAQSGWQQLGRWQTAPPDPFYIHADNHHIVFDENTAGKIYVTNDGGVFRSVDNGVTWTPMVKNYSTVQFYSIGIGANGVVMGGAQDNGTLLIDPAAPIRGNAREVFGGDGGYSELSKLNPNVIFAESQRGTVARSPDFGASFTNFIERRRVDPNAYYGTADWANWIMPFDLWEKLDDPNSTDSIRFGADTLTTNLGFGGGGRTFTGGFRVPEPYTFTRLDQNSGNVVADSSIFVTTSLLIRAGGQRVTADANGNLQGDGTGNFDPSTGEFEVVFNSPVVTDIIAFVETQYNPGTIIRLQSDHNELPIYDTIFNGLQPNESVMVQDPIQSIFVMGTITHRSNLISNASKGQLTGRNHTGGIWMTREAVSNVEGIPQWHHIGVLQDREKPTSIEISDDGDMIWVGTDRGNLYRFSNLINARDSASADIDSLYISNQWVRGSTSIVQKYSVSIGSAGRAVTSISIHPFDKNRVIATLGNYGRSNYVFYSRNAGGPAPTFNSVQGDLPSFPVYAATWNYNDPEDSEVFIGTEFGLFVTEDINVPASTVSWTDANFNMPNVPVLSLRQERTVRYDLKSANDFEGAIYVGTHGRGIWKTSYSSDFVSIDENDLDEEVVSRSQLNVYPNPTTNRINIDLELTNRTDVEIAIRDMNGRLVKQVTYRKLGAEVPSIEVNVEQLPKGAYLINMTAGKKAISGKFIKQ